MKLRQTTPEKERGLGAMTLSLWLTYKVFQWSWRISKLQKDLTARDHWTGPHPMTSYGCETFLNSSNVSSLSSDNPEK